MIEIVIVDRESPYLPSVKSLWRKHSATLGLYPDGAFQERAAAQQILGAVRDGELIGYLLYYTQKTRRTARITHLCVASDSQGSGVARKLTDELKRRTKGLRGINLSCRRDFPAHDMWPKLGFSFAKEVIGRSADGHELTSYWFEHEAATLFSEVDSASEGQIRAVIDANVFFDLEVPQRPSAKESGGLLADWIQPEVTLFVTPELDHEIGHNESAVERAHRREAASRYSLALAAGPEFDQALARIESIRGKGTKRSDAADNRQLAWTLVAECDVFLTKDESVLKDEEVIYREFGLRIETPATFIARLDEIRDEQKYQKSRVIGTEVEICRLASDAEGIADAFLVPKCGEKRHQLLSRLHATFANPDRSECVVLRDEAKAPVCVFLRERTAANCCEVPMLRLRGSDHGTRKGRSVLLATITTILNDAVRDGCDAVRVSDPTLAPVIQDTLRDRQFFQGSDCWVKLCPSGVIPASEVKDRLRTLVSRIPGAATELTARLDKLTEDLEDAPPGRIVELERIIWPGKISGTNIPSYIVPIRPHWSTDLFDGRLATGRLWAADTELVLNPDSVYYRAPTPRVFQECGRILWYVSKGKTTGSKMLRACSSLTAVQVGPPTDLFRRFRRLGVYDWKDVQKTASSVTDRLMALEFTDTELLTAPLGWTRLKATLKQHNLQNHTFQSPLRISDALFFDLYTAGTAHRQ